VVAASAEDEQRHQGADGDEQNTPPGPAQVTSNDAGQAAHRQPPTIEAKMDTNSGAKMARA
jgi:hypothetical protein